MKYSHLIYNCILSLLPTSDETENKIKALSLSKEIEAGQFAFINLNSHSNDFLRNYKAKTYNIMFNLKMFDTKYADLVHTLVKTGQIEVHDSVQYYRKPHVFKPFDIASMNSMDLQEWLYIETKNRWDKFNRLEVKDLESVQDSVLECSSCKHTNPKFSKKVSYYQLQVRSADEGITTFASCLNCGKHWKF